MLILRGVCRSPYVLVMMRLRAVGSEQHRPHARRRRRGLVPAAGRARPDPLRALPPHGRWRPIRTPASTRRMATAFGCAAGGARSYRLGVRTNCIGADLVGPIVVAGEVAAYGSERCGVDTGFTQVLVRDLRTGKRVSASPAVTSPGPESFASVSALVVRSDGAAAWVAIATSIGTHADQRRASAR